MYFTVKDNGFETSKMEIVQFFAASNIIIGLKNLYQQVQTSTTLNNTNNKIKFSKPASTSSITRPKSANRQSMN